MPRCRFCASPLERTLVDLGGSPVANDYLNSDQLSQMEPFYPLHVFVCEHCLLVQIPEVRMRESLFAKDYAYFSSYSDSWLKHAKCYANTMMQRFSLGNDHKVVEVASNDGYLLQYFAAAGVSVLGVEPADNCATEARKKGVATVSRFFGETTARELAEEHMADLMVANNVLAHVPDINDFVEGFRVLLKPEGVATFEFPHLLNLIEKNEFDTIYHEHYSYLSLFAVEQLLEAHGLSVFDVEELATHGGSLRLYVCHRENTLQTRGPGLQQVRDKEVHAGLTTPEGYAGFESRVRKVKRDLLAFLIQACEKGQSVVGYGAPAKGNTLLNYCGIRTDLLAYTVDRSPHKQGKFLPGTHIPIFSPEKIMETKPDFVLILPWNLKTEIIEQMCSIRKWGGQFVVPIPELTVVP